jgi:NADH:ubiquinone oxidoreductase subunit 5 (subunit L)/multisubunit Na+/H+ antiporter MnhA subunit
VNLAYSSVSQMGLMTVALGLGLLDASVWPAVLTGLLIYALHHGLAKGVLFLGVGIAGSVGADRRARMFVYAGLGIAALALTAAPLTSGAIAKGMLKDNLDVTGDWYTAMSWLVSVSSVMTALLMVRFLFLMRTEMETVKHSLGGGMLVPWASLVGFVVLAAWAAPEVFDLDAAAGTTVTVAKLWDGTWPVVVAIALGWAGWRQRHRLTWMVDAVPPGDVGALGEWAFGRIVRPGTTGMGVFAGKAAVHWHTYSGTIGRLVAADLAARTEMRLASWRYLGIVLTVAVIGLVGLLSW